MDHKEMFSYFKRIIPIPEKEISLWVPEGPYSIVIRLSSGYNLRFMIMPDTHEWNISNAR